MKVAVLMSTYNGERYIREQIDSILAQQGDFQLDLWVRDDNSSDNTKTILQNYADEGKLYWYTGDNLRSARSFVDLLKNCEGYDYYSFADQDDYWLPEKLQAAFAQLGKDMEPRMYFANAELVNADLVSLGRNVYQQSPKLDLETLSCAGGILGCTTVFNKCLAEAIQKKSLPENMIMHDFYISELCLLLGGKIIFDSNVYMQYRQHGANVIGVSSGWLKTVKSRFHDITKKQIPGIAEQANQIMRLYESEIELDKIKWITRVSKYKKSSINRIRLASSYKTKYINRNMGLKLRISILLGNR